MVTTGWPVRTSQSPNEELALVTPAAPELRALPRLRIGTKWRIALVAPFTPAGTPARTTSRNRPLSSKVQACISPSGGRTKSVVPGPIVEPKRDRLWPPIFGARTGNGNPPCPTRPEATSIAFAPALVNHSSLAGSCGMKFAMRMTGKRGSTKGVAAPSPNLWR